MFLVFIHFRKNATVLNTTHLPALSQSGRQNMPPQGLGNSTNGILHTYLSHELGASRSRGQNVQPSGSNTYSFRDTPLYLPPGYTSTDADPHTYSALNSRSALSRSRGLNTPSAGLGTQVYRNNPYYVEPDESQPGEQVRLPPGSSPPSYRTAYGDVSYYMSRPRPPAVTTDKDGYELPANPPPMRFTDLLKRDDVYNADVSLLKTMGRVIPWT